MIPKDEGDRILVAGRPNFERCDNKVITSKYTLITFLPKAVTEQFRRVANMYFLVIGTIMAVGWYSDLYESAISPWTTFGPLVFVVSISLLQEGAADMGRHRSDSLTNNHSCVVLRRADELEESNGERDMNINGGKDVTANLAKSYFLPSSLHASQPGCDVAFESIKRMNIRQGHIVLVRNREMIPADVVLLASSADNGNAYIETSSIDGETNLKLRASPVLPKDVLEKILELHDDNVDAKPTKNVVRETLEQATKRITLQTSIGFPRGLSSLDNPANPVNPEESSQVFHEQPSSGLRLLEKTGNLGKFGIGAVKEVGGKMKSRMGGLSSAQAEEEAEPEVKYVMALKTEPPNASVNTFNGLLFLPPIQLGGASVEIPLNGENILLRGAVLRNTEWVIGIACYTGKDTKLVMNSFDTPSKFSRLDLLMNRTVLYILCIVGLCIAYLATAAVIQSNRDFDQMWYIGFKKNTTAPWPTLPELAPPEWEKSSSNWLQVYLLFVTLLSNFVPLSLYVTIELVTVVMRIFINLDVNMYDAYTNTRTVARSTTVTDLGQVQYIFSDKTGTLTQNIMKFKRCSVDSLVFGAPIIAMKHGTDDRDTHPFHPLDKLLVGKVPAASVASVHQTRARQHSEGLTDLGVVHGDVSAQPTYSDPLTFNGEMFLRVMSLCHTVVVEKDFESDKAQTPEPINNATAGFFDKINRLFKATPSSLSEHDVEKGTAGTIVQEAELVDPSVKGKGGAPGGFAYQAESPDEGALVEASSLKFDFQVVGRDSSGIRLSMPYPSLLSDPKIIDGLKSGSLSEMDVAADTASPDGELGSEAVVGGSMETWEVLAVNKFDSTRKRMSIIVRSPQELGSIPMVLVKGADSAMLDPKILRNPAHVVLGNEDLTSIKQLGSQTDDDQAGEWDKQCVLSLQSHLGEFAREGLRTLVLGVRILSEGECSDWLAQYTAAAASLKNRDEKLTAAAASIEQRIHIVGATAIEDKLQDEVPETIEMLGKAGIKLWVLTGDKRETAMEIGYATNVLNEKMRPGLTVVAQGPSSEVQARMAMAFLKLVKHAKLPHYQRSAISEDDPKRVETFLFRFGKFRRGCSRHFRRFYHKYIKVAFLYCCAEVDPDDPKLKAIDREEKKEESILQPTERCRNVRNRAEKIVRDYLNSPEGMSKRKTRTKLAHNVEIPDEDMIASDLPDVFNRASSAKLVLEDRRSHGNITESELRDLTMVNLTAHEIENGEPGIVDEDLLSMKSFLPTDAIESAKTFDLRKRNILERVFAVDKDVRHGRLIKHLTKEKREKLSSIREEDLTMRDVRDTADLAGDVDADGPRGLVIEGAALEKLLGDSELEEILFSVANTCNSVIACRVSPAQKAQLVQLVRSYVVPEPVTLAIGDGANDVGMIQEAHVGVGISGKEGQQAVNASDFAIAQFRFLLDLTLIHGRWNFMRLCTVVLFSFYKNAVMAGVLIAYSPRSLYSGTPLFDEWCIAVLNFVAGLPIAALGAFDRCLDREYVLKNPDTYTPTRRNELITRRILLRWIILVFIHIFTLYYLSVTSLGMNGAGGTSAFFGLMSNSDPERPGDGEGGDLKSVGFVAFSCLIILLVYKVLYESRSIIIGQWPPFRCWNKDIEAWPNRLAYTWIANGYLSIGFYLFFIYIYQALGRSGPGTFSAFVNTVYHSFNTRVRTWMVLILVPTAAMAFDVAGKVLGNLFYPTQTQIHVEVFVTRGKRDKADPKVQDLRDQAVHQNGNDPEV